MIPFFTRPVGLASAVPVVPFAATLQFFFELPLPALFRL